MELRLISIGFGAVGRALVTLLAEKAQELYERYDLTVRFTGVYTRARGPVIMPEGMSAFALLQSGFLTDAPRRSEPPNTLADALTFLTSVPAEVALELTTLNPLTGQPAIDHIRAALLAGKNVVTANKGPIAHAYRELRALAEERGLALRFESTVMDGTPIFDLVEAALPVTRIWGFDGVLNSTSNYVLSRMAQGETLEQAVAGAQRLGIAEADPGYDLDGWDAAVKATVLANVLMGADLRPQDVRREGLGAEAMRQAQASLPPGQTLKQTVEARRAGDGVSVHVRLVPPLGPGALFATLSGMEAALRLHTDTMGDLTLVEGEGGPGQTALGVLADLVTIARNL